MIKRIKPGPLPRPATREIADLAERYFRIGWGADYVSERLGIDLAWCRTRAKRLGPLGPIDWCGECTYDTRMRATPPDGRLTPCPHCTAPETP